MMRVWKRQVCIRGFGRDWSVCTWIQKETCQYTRVWKETDQYTVNTSLSIQQRHNKCGHAILQAV